MTTIESQDYLNSANLRRTFGKAISFDPIALYEAANTDNDDAKFSEKIVQYLTPHLDDQRFDFLISSAIDDTQTLYNPALDDCDGITKDEALAVAQHPTTVLAMAELSRHGQTRLLRYAHLPNRQRLFRISLSRKCLMLGSMLPDEMYSATGCPFAGKDAQPEEVPRIDPLFKRFVPWAGTLAVLRYFDASSSADR